MKENLVILGAGMTGLAAGLASRAPVFEAEDNPGGICSSYYLAPGERAIRHCPKGKDAYRFEIGGGHWIFGGDPLVLGFIESLAPLAAHSRISSVFLPKTGTFVPYPLQNNLHALGRKTARKAVRELELLSRTRYTGRTMADWLDHSFGPTLCELFFHPFHELYTSGLFRRIAPQDAYKSPIDLALVKRGAATSTPAVGYNTTFVYPRQGLDHLTRGMAARAKPVYGKRAVRVRLDKKSVEFDDGSRVRYERLMTTLPLNVMAELSGLRGLAPADPSTAVLVLNIGAVKGPNCPPDHWVYIPYGLSGFHRVGFYSHVDDSFLPGSGLARSRRVSIYVEKAYAGREKPSPAELQRLAAEVAATLRDWGWITEVEVSHPTWIEVGYTWRWPGSKWKEEAVRALRRRGVHAVGRYARWNFQGIADSIRDGFIAGSSLGA